MMEAVRTSETSINFNVTPRRYIPEDSELHIRRRENLKSHNYPSICLKERKTSVRIAGIRADFNPGLPEYEAGVLVTRP
jgi:hypothetical protein